MPWLAVLLAVSPIVVIFVLIAFLKRAADTAGVLGWVFTLAVAILYFKTSPRVCLTASAAGVVASLPITLMVAASLFQMGVMLECGAVARLVATLKGLAREDRVAQILIINVGFGTLLTALGATPVSILPPIMLALGYSSFVAIALPALGYDALCTYALLGIPVVVYGGFTGLEPNEAGRFFARYMPAISTAIAFGMLYLVGKFKLMVRGAVPTLVAGLTAGFVAVGMNRLGLTTLTGVAAGAAVVLAMVAYVAVRGRKVYDAGEPTTADVAARGRMSLAAAISPWLILVAAAALANTPALPFFGFLFERLAMPVEIIPGAPTKIRFFWQAYFWVTVATFLALPFLKPTGEEFGRAVRKWARRMWRPALAAGVYFAIAYVINHSGKVTTAEGWILPGDERNMVHVLAHAAASTFGDFYGLGAPFLGLLGGFISGSETSSIAMLTHLHLDTAAAAEKIRAVGLIWAAASGIGGGLASVISPAKLQNAAAIIDAIGEEGRVLRKTVFISLVITGLCALMTLLWTA
ncbi:MAG: L-lactate permease [Candidatus Coatesbacteria bacterium]|nr:MAG: L-lactate permease [Candidatus Coatesbacteria bacterium]